MYARKKLKKCKMRHVFSFFGLEAGNYSILRQLASIKTTISDNYFFEQKYAALTLATKILKNQGLVSKTIGVNLIVNYRQFARYARRRW